MSLTQIAEEILVNARRLDEYTKAKDLPPASFDQDVLEDLPAELEESRRALVDSTQTLKRLALGPVGTSKDIIFGVADTLSLRVLYVYKIPQIVPLDGSINYHKISERSGLSESLVYRFVRHAMANHIFAEASPGYVCHTASSRMLATDSDAFDAVGMMTCEHGPAFNKFIEAQTKYPNSGEQKETGWCIENDSSLPLFSFLASHPDRARRFGTGMRWFTKGEVWDLKHLTAAHDWKSLDRTDAVLVDVGGGQGGVAQVLAKQNKNLNIKVQDLHGTAEQGRKMLPSEFKGRIEFVGKDFIMEQPIKGADVYFFRWILHNWSDKYAILILQTLIPAMKDGTKVLVYEVVLSDKPEINWSEKHGLDMDLIMATCFNGCERNERGWRELFERADKRFIFKGITTPQGSMMSLIEAVWEP